MNYLIYAIKGEVHGQGGFLAEITPASVINMYRLVEGLFTDKEWDAQNRWTSCVLSIRKRKRGLLLNNGNDNGYDNDNVIDGSDNDNEDD
jgi:hypothetical protein